MYVHSVDFGDCLYKPFLRIPRCVKVLPVSEGGKTVNPDKKKRVQDLTKRVD